MDQVVIQATAGASVNLDASIYTGSDMGTGLTIAMSIERESDGYWWNGSAFQSSYTTVSATERTGNAGVKGKYRVTLTLPGTAGKYQASVQYALGGGAYLYWRASIDGIPAGYAAMAEMRGSSSEAKDRHTLQWFKDQAPITSGITVPRLTVTDVSDPDTPAVLIDDVTPTDAGSGFYVYVAETVERITKGREYVATWTATIDGATRTWVLPIGRDI